MFIRKNKLRIIILQPVDGATDGATRRVICPASSLTTIVCKSLIHGLVTSRLDYGIAMLFGIADPLLHRLEMVQRSAARIVLRIRRGDRQSMTTVLQRLHWLYSSFGRPSI